jgi:2,4-dienoyl-CoA reductase-like NADH-dependent reductase (Old Yellow Enzyme family)
MPSQLFSPFTMRGLSLSNRIVVAPMCQYGATDGVASDWHIMHLGNFALSGAGLVITEATAVEPRGRISPLCLGLYSDACETALARVIGFCRQYGAAKLGVQLAHAGRKGSVSASFEPRKFLQPHEGGWRTISASPVDDGFHAVPEMLDEAGIAQLIRDWVAATERAERLGFDLIELHFAHGYLVNQFMSPLGNLRSDAYGGDRARRMRLPIEIFEACRAVWPADKPMGVRISAVDWVPDGWDMADSVAFAAAMKARNCDFICASSGGMSMQQKIVAGPNYQVPFAEEMKRTTGITTMAVGQITEPEQAEEIIANGRADMVALARRMLFNPRWPWHAAIALGEHMIYPPRYRTCHPLMGTALKFPESREMRQALTDLADADRERVRP